MCQAHASFDLQGEPTTLQVGAFPNALGFLTLTGGVLTTSGARLPKSLASVHPQQP